MTVQQMYKRSLSLMLIQERDGEDFKNFVVDFFNNALSDLWKTNNLARRRAGKEELKERPVVESLMDENPYETQLETALIYNLTAQILIADESYEQADVYTQKYYAAIENELMPRLEKVVDIYATSED